MRLPCVLLRCILSAPSHCTSGNALTASYVFIVWYAARPSHCSSTTNSSRLQHAKLSVVRGTLQIDACYIFMYKCYWCYWIIKFWKQSILFYCSVHRLNRYKINKDMNRKDTHKLPFGACFCWGKDRDKVRTSMGQLYLSSILETKQKKRRQMWQNVNYFRSGYPVNVIFWIFLYVWSS